MEAAIEGNVLVLRLRLKEPPTLSATRKSLVVASSYGNKVTNVEINGKKVTVGVNAYIKA